MKRFSLGLAMAAVLAVPGSALAVHHVFIPASECPPPVAGEPSNDNGKMRFGLRHHFVLLPGSLGGDLPLPPGGTPGAGNGQGGDNCANG